MESLTKAGSNIQVELEYYTRNRQLSYGRDWRGEKLPKFAIVRQLPGHWQSPRGVSGLRCGALGIVSVMRKSPTEIYVISRFQVWLRDQRCINIYNKTKRTRIKLCLISYRLKFLSSSSLYVRGLQIRHICRDRVRWFCSSS